MFKVSHKFESDPSMLPRTGFAGCDSIIGLSLHRIVVDSRLLPSLNELLDSHQTESRPIAELAQNEQILLLETACRQERDKVHGTDQQSQ